MKCEKCLSSLIFVDAFQDKMWCKSCGYMEEVDYKDIPNEGEQNG